MGVPTTGSTNVGKKGRYNPQAAITSITDSTGGTSSNTLAAQVGEYSITFHIDNLGDTNGFGGTSAVDLVTDWVPGHKFAISSWEFITTTAGTGASADQTIKLQIGAADVTGGTLQLELADTAAVGQLTAGETISAANTGSSTAALSVLLNASGTAFTAGAGDIVIHLRNMETADAFASLAAKQEEILDAIRNSDVILT